MAASVFDTMESINSACQKRGGKYAGYRCEVVSWDDACRGTSGGSLSCWGSNITDTYLKSRTGELLFTVRSDNWNERLGRVSTSDVAVVVGDGSPRGQLQPLTLRSFLKEIGRFGGYAGLSPNADLSSDTLDSYCSIRFQTTFLPVTGEQGALEVTPEAYNYNTMSDEEPKNLVLLCTTQGVAVQQDGAGAKRLFHHAVDDDGVIHRYWLEAEASKHKVGGPQKETVEERADALKRGKATSSVIGTQAMGQRFNVLMTIQVPLFQPQRPHTRQKSSSLWFLGSAQPQCEAMEEAEFDEDCEACALQNVMESLAAAPPPGGIPTAHIYAPAMAAHPPPRIGTATAARVSRGSEEDTWGGLTVKEPKRHASEHITVTVVMYNTVADGVPSEQDVVAAIDDLESLYKACGSHGRLADRAFDFMKTPLTAVTQAGIWAKLLLQPKMS